MNHGSSIGNNGIRHKRREKDFALSDHLKFNIFILLINTPQFFFPNYLHFNGGELQKNVAGRLLNNSGWFLREFSFKRIFNINNCHPVMYCWGKRLGPIALFFHLLYEAGLIHTDTGKCYMQLIADLISCGNKKVSVHTLSNECCKLLASPRLNKAVISGIKAMVKEIVDAGKIPKPPKG